METLIFYDSYWWTWVILPFLIFLSRIIDQSIGTIRLIFISKGYKVLAPVLGFFEVIIWLLAIAQVMKHLNNPISYIAYGAGFGIGNYIGIVLEEKLSLGHVLIRIVPRFDTTMLCEHLRNKGYGVTSFDAEGVKSKVKILLTITKRKNVPYVTSCINHYNPNSFYTIEEIKSIREGYFGAPQQKRSFDRRWFSKKEK